MKQCANCMIRKPDSSFRRKLDETLAIKCVDCEQETGKTPFDE